MLSAHGGRAGYLSSLRGTFLAVAVMIMLPFGGLLAYLGYAQLTLETDRVRHEALMRAKALAEAFEAHLTARLDALAAAADAVGASEDGAAIQAQIRRIGRSFPDAERMLVVNQLGTVIAGTASVEEGRPPFLGDQPWFKRAATSTQPFVGEPAQLGAQLVVRLYAPARARTGQLRGVVVADLGLKGLETTLSHGRLETGGVVEIRTEGGLLVARQPALSRLQDVQGLPEHGDPRLAGVAQIRPLGWIVTVGLAPTHILAGTQSLVGRLAAGAMAAALLGLGLALAVARRTARALDDLRAVVSQLEEWHIPANVPVIVGGEVGALTHAVNRLLGRLRTRLEDEEALKREAQRLAAIAPRLAQAVECVRALPPLPDVETRPAVPRRKADRGGVVVPDNLGFSRQFSR